MTPIQLKQVVDCMGAMVRNDECQPTSDPPLTLSLRAQDGEVYVLPLSERGAAGVWEVISLWRQGQHFGKPAARWVKR
jgi:hypothetical protein